MNAAGVYKDNEIAGKGHKRNGLKKDEKGDDEHMDSKEDTGEDMGCILAPGATLEDNIIQNMNRLDRSVIENSQEMVNLYDKLLHFLAV